MFCIVGLADIAMLSSNTHVHVDRACKQHSTSKAVTFPKKKELPWVGLEPTTLYTLDRALYRLSYLAYSYKHVDCIYLPIGKNRYIHF